MNKSLTEYALQTIKDLYHDYRIPESGLKNGRFNCKVLTHGRTINYSFRYVGGEIEFTAKEA